MSSNVLLVFHGLQFLPVSSNHWNLSQIHGLKTWKAEKDQLTRECVGYDRDQCRARTTASTVCESAPVWPRRTRCTWVLQATVKSLRAHCVQGWTTLVFAWFSPLSLVNDVKPDDDMLTFCCTKHVQELVCTDVNARWSLNILVLLHKSGCTWCPVFVFSDQTERVCSVRRGRLTRREPVWFEVRSASRNPLQFSSPWFLRQKVKDASSLSSTKSTRRLAVDHRKVRSVRQCKCTRIQFKSLSELFSAHSTVTKYALLVFTFYINRHGLQSPDRSCDKSKCKYFEALIASSVAPTHLQCLVVPG